MVNHYAIRPKFSSWLSVKRRLIYLLLTAFTATFCIISSSGLAIESPATPTSVTQAHTTAQLVQQGRILYESGRYQDAIAILQQAIQTYGASGDRLQQALALSNLSLVYQQLGAWTEATQAIEESLTLLESSALNQAAERPSVLAQALDIRGRLQLATGQAESALTTWQQAAALYDQLGHTAKALQSQINQAEALQTLGLYRRAIGLLTDLSHALQDQPNSLMKAAALRSLGDALLVAGDLQQSQTGLEQSLSIAEALQSQTAIADANLSLGNLTRAQAVVALNLSNMVPDDALAVLNSPAQPSLSPTEIILRRQQTQAAQRFSQQIETALNYYQHAIERSPSIYTQIQAQLNQLSLLVETHHWQRAEQLSSTLQTALNQLPPSRSRIYDQIDLAESLVKLDSGMRDGEHEQSPSFQQMAAQLLATAGQQAKALGDVRAESFAQGNLGKLYEQTQQWNDAKQVTRHALLLAQQINASDVAYQWQWQLGRLFKAEGDRAGAIHAYNQAVTTLKTLRSDLVAVNRDVQFSFRESVEPVYREFVDLLLPEGMADINVESLIQARDVIEGLQIAELDNFFREACLDTAFQLDRVIDQANLPSAIFYTIVLPDRLEIVLKLPQRDLIHLTSHVSQVEVERTIDSFLAELKRPYTSQILQSLSQQLYDWLIRPGESALAESGVETLVFVLDGALRNIPMAALYDGQHYLIENYSVALAPGLQLPDPKPLEQRDFRALVAGLSEARRDFPPLNYVETEVEQIKSDVPSEVLLNQSFTLDNFQTLLRSTPFSIVHVATHGQFSSNAAETFILAWDSPINVNELRNLLQTRDVVNPEPVELLVLSACRTATGDRRATLGLAGVAVRAGARSTIASLWNLDDDSGAVLMSQFYQELIDHPISKAEALRRAQRSLLANAQYEAPRFWAPYVLLGNWL